MFVMLTVSLDVMLLLRQYGAEFVTTQWTSR